MPMNESAVSFGFVGSGLGDRHQQIVDGVTTNYTLDLAAGLTQVLDDGTNTYLYGNGRIAQAGSTTEYFLGDALGSVRQLADPTGAMTLTQSYAPYGDVVSSIGSSQTNYAFTGEARDANELTYLRARYLDANTGRFISRDTWAGNYNSPLSLNKWNYTEGNPVNYTDPTGHYKDCPIGYLSTDKGCIRTPNIISRQQWGAKPPHEIVMCGILGCVVMGEGFYDPECNPSGYVLYSILHPDRTLADIYDTIVVHHSGNTNDQSVQSVQNGHNIKGDVDIDYHYVIAKNGAIYEGRDIGVRGAHVKLGNTGKIGILIMGDFEPGDYVNLPVIGEIKVNDEPADNPTEAQKSSLEEMIVYLDARYGINEIGGHKDFNSTRCPGENLLPFVNYLKQKYNR